jgi:hypothetical protein
LLSRSYDEQPKQKSHEACGDFYSGKRLFQLSHNVTFQYRYVCDGIAAVLCLPVFGMGGYYFSNPHDHGNRPKTEKFRIPVIFDPLMMINPTEAFYA